MANVTYTVPNKSGSYDGDMVVKQYTSMIIDSGDTVTTDYPCRGLMILVQGDCTINGTIDLRNKAPFADPTASGGSDSNAVDSNGLRFPFVTASGSTTLNPVNTLLNGCGNTARSVMANFIGTSANKTVLSLVRQGASGGARRTSIGVGNDGSNGSTGQTGGGGGGGYYGGSGSSGAGAYGNCWGGGSGGGGMDNGNVSQNATNWCGAGGNGVGYGGLSAQGGAGHPAGTSGSTSILANAGDGYAGGGALILIVGGNLTIGASGVINVSALTLPTGSIAGGGGHAGGGNVILAHKGTYTNNGTVNVQGGQATNTNEQRGGHGGNGSLQTLQIN
tara:strand:+ start:677 stop:1675 length:999 start_codon:yes stop_codon:yes gene_type:complete